MHVYLSNTHLSFKDFSHLKHISGCKSFRRISPSVHMKVHRHNRMQLNYFGCEMDEYNCVGQKAGMVATGEISDTK